MRVFPSTQYLFSFSTRDRIRSRDKPSIFWYLMTSAACLRIFPITNLTGAVGNITWLSKVPNKPFCGVQSGCSGWGSCSCTTTHLSAASSFDGTSNIVFEFQLANLNFYSRSANESTYLHCCSHFASENGQKLWLACIFQNTLVIQHLDIFEMTSGLQQLHNAWHFSK